MSATQVSLANRVHLSILMNQSTDEGCSSKGLNYPENQARIHSSGFRVFTGQFTRRFESLTLVAPHPTVPVLSALLEGATGPRQTCCLICWQGWVAVSVFICF